MGKYFGTDGFRGEANRELTAMHAFQLGQFLGSFYGSQARRARVVIGKDTRASGYMLEDALCAGLTSAGADAYPAARHPHAQRVLCGPHRGL